ncbi:MAG TPA: GIDE domain-containing protein [Candidatus Eisenbacteria bacterium]|nr:GIDE domain-containing protein [Candidatus Eisenbacteria bacterium]
MMIPGPLAIGATFALVTGPGLFWRSFRDLRARQLLQNTPASPIRSMAMGLVEINGKVQPRSVLEAPFTGRPCAFWEVEIAVQGRRGWNTVHRNASGHPFFVHDPTGTALVYPEGARCTLPLESDEVCQGMSLPELYASYIHDVHPALGLLWRTGSVRFRERALEPGEPVFVLGTAMPRSQAVDVSMSDDAVQAGTATGTDDAAARHAGLLQALDQDVRGVIRRSELERTFIISQQSERDLAFQLGLRAIAGVFGGPALTLLGLAYWLDTLRVVLAHHG